MKVFHLVAFFSGLLFAAGLVVSGMTQPSKVLAFLDFTSAWDPSLMFVMVGAIGVYAVAYRWTIRRSAPFAASEFQIPPPAKVDKRLVIGATLFGVGWGLVGYCPGPAIVATVSLQKEAVLFCASMLLGMYLFSLVVRSR